MINAETQVCGSIARRASSLGAAMYNAAYEDLGLNFVYIPFGTEDTHGAIAAMRALRIRGFAAADPHNVQCAPLLDEIDPIAEKIGSVNTILNENGNLMGYNSDWSGFHQAFEEVAPISGRRAVVIGAGGASRSVVYALVAGGAQDVFVINRTPEKAASIARQYGLMSGDLDTLPDLKEYDVLVNTTSVGSAGGPTTELVGLDILERYEIVADTVFSPVDTALIKQAKKIGIKTVSGWRMLLHQGLFQFRLFTGTEPPIELIENVLFRGLTT